MFSFRNSTDALNFLEKKGRHITRSHRAQPNLILLDLHLDGKDGTDMIEEVRSRLNEKTVPVVVFSNDYSPELLSRAYARGANSCVQKPPEANEFRDVVEAIGSYWLGMWNQ